MKIFMSCKSYLTSFSLSAIFIPSAIHATAVLLDTHKNTTLLGMAVAEKVPRT